MDSIIWCIAFEFDCDLVGRGEAYCRSTHPIKWVRPPSVARVDTALSTVARIVITVVGLGRDCTIPRRDPLRETIYFHHCSMDEFN